MQTLFSIIVPLVLINHGFTSIVLKIISMTKSGFKYRSEILKK